MKTYFKTISKLFKGHFVKWIVLVLITIIAVGLSTGLGATSSQIRNEFDISLKENNFADIILKSTQVFGFSNDDIEDLLLEEDIESIKGVFQYDYQNQTLYSIDFDNQENSYIELESGQLPSKANEIVIEKPHNGLINYEIGDKIKYSSPITNNYEIELVISGFVENSYYIYHNSYPNLVDDNYEIDTIIYLNSNSSIIQIPTITDLYIKYNHEFSYFSDDYTKYIELESKEIEKLLNPDDYALLTHEEFVSIIVIKANANKMDLISVIFPVFFLIVILIISSSTITKLIADERSVIASFLSLGYKPFLIKVRYYIFTMSSIIIGSVLGLFVGFYTLSTLVYQAFESLLRMPPWTPTLYLDVGILISLVLLAGILIIMFFQLRQTFKEQPASLLRPKAPKVGKKIFLEYIPFIWKRLKFKYKSSLRNLFRYKLNFIMTTLSIFGSVVLLFAGLGLFENTLVIKDGTEDSIQLISLIILMCAAGISILVTYHLTNMNIDHRKKEIASLRVLGYHKSETGLYIYREIFIMAGIGIILGLPTGYFLIDIVFKYIEYGTKDNITWISWVCAGLFSVFFVLISSLFLYPKLTKVNMAEALKTVE